MLSDLNIIVKRRTKKRANSAHCRLFNVLGPPPVTTPERCSHANTRWALQLTQTSDTSAPFFTQARGVHVSRSCLAPSCRRRHGMYKRSIQWSRLRNASQRYILVWKYRASMSGVSKAASGNGLSGRSGPITEKLPGVPQQAWRVFDWR